MLSNTSLHAYSEDSVNRDSSYGQEELPKRSVINKQAIAKTQSWGRGGGGAESYWWSSYGKFLVVKCELH